MLSQAEYIWIDGARPTQELRSKTRLVELHTRGTPAVSDFPTWGFDGSSTYQAEGGDSDLTLRPVRIAPDPIRGQGSYLVLCEVTDSDGEPHRSNTRARLRRLLQGPAGEVDAWFGFEQEYTLFKDGRPLGFPENGYPRPQGPFYCGVGGDRVFGRDFVEAHMRACMDAGLMIYGVNAEVMPGQWEFQIGHRGVSGESSDPLTVSDHLILARWLMQRVGERFGVDPRLDPKPVKGDWNGAGAHTNFSTRSMREPGGLAEIRTAIDKLGRRHGLHVGRYGYGLADRLTGLHETCSIEEFKGGVADRGASIRVPRHVETRGAGYLEDRRPGANCDPYVVCAALLETVCDSRELAAAG